jgi:hypothetical protein
VRIVHLPKSPNLRRHGKITIPSLLCPPISDELSALLGEPSVNVGRVQYNSLEDFRAGLLARNLSILLCLPFLCLSTLRDRATFFYLCGLD